VGVRQWNGTKAVRAISPITADHAKVASGLSEHIRRVAIAATAQASAAPIGSRAATWKAEPPGWSTSITPRESPIFLLIEGSIGSKHSACVLL
jgi:hypothetical protein